MRNVFEENTILKMLKKSTNKEELSLFHFTHDFNCKAILPAKLSVD